MTTYRQSRSRKFGTARPAGSPPPLWGRDRVGGNPKWHRAGFPPPLTPPHKGEGNPVEPATSDEELLVRHFASAIGREAT